MKRFVLAGVVALAGCSEATANAADMGRRQAMPTKAPMYAAPYNWTGFYVGINGGGGFGHSSCVPSPRVSTPRAAWSAAPSVTTGRWASWCSASKATSTGSGNGSGACVGTTCETRNDWLGTARGRIGYAFDRFMPYVTGGAAFGDVKNTVAGIGSRPPRASAGPSAAAAKSIAGPWSAKVEYLYVDLGETARIGACWARSTCDFRSNVVRAGLNYRF